MSKITYQLTSKLADGILCSSYQGVAHLPNGTQRDVVLKQIHQHFTQDSVMMSHLTGFADVARGLNHPGLTAVWDLGQHQGYTFFVREFLPGISLRRLFSLVQENQAALSPSMAIYLVQEMADAISAIHRHRVPGDQPIYLFHGGLAPENILLTKIGNVVVSDAGLDVIFWRDSDAAWKLRQRKLPYQPPEYDSGERPMRRGDGYGVAALLYQMIMGTPPPGAGAGGASWVPPSSVHPRVTETFDQILFQCLHPQVEERMVQMKELQKAFRQEGLLTQEAMERRDAMAYLEALVSEAFDPNHGDRHALPIVGSFEMTSLLPSRDDLLPPEQRYRPPVYDHTDAFHPQRPNQPVPDPKDPISIADPLGAPLHESSELAAKTLASAFPQPEEEEDILDGDDMLIPVEDDEDEEGLEAAPAAISAAPSHSPPSFSCSLLFHICACCGVLWPRKAITLNSVPPASASFCLSNRNGLRFAPQGAAILGIVEDTYPSHSTQFICKTEPISLTFKHSSSAAILLQESDILLDRKLQSMYYH